jgi:hypothetical protein
MFYLVDNDVLDEGSIVTYFKSWILWYFSAVSFVGQHTLNSITLLLLFNCRSLTDNSFSGPIPASIGNLSELYWLDLAVNKLDGKIPDTIGILQSVEVM